MQFSYNLSYNMLNNDNIYISKIYKFVNIANDCDKISPL